MKTMIKLNQKIYPEYTLDYIKDTMSLRKPQWYSVKILNDILDEIPLSKTPDISSAEKTVNELYPIFTSFDHPFMSMTFALATGVGKTKLMGAFITYLYTNKGVRNFFVVAPSLTIYEKLKNDLGNPSPDNEKYVFKGVSCFANRHPIIWADDDYKNKGTLQLENDMDVNIYIFNISKFNSDDRQIRHLNEYLGQSFYDYLSSLPDLVLLMDESHHYRAKSGFQSINELHPILGLELTATPKVQDGTKEILFKNVVYEYPLSKAIQDGYTRTPYAMARRDLDVSNLSNEEIDQIMLNDGIRHHENMKAALKKFAANTGNRLVKPFMLVVCKDTDHANKIYEFIKSSAFQDGRYKDKVIIIHSNLTGDEKDENIKLLLSVERNDNPTEIVIHVNKLKEGWDVNNLYTIVPLRTATSRVLREQTIGRGLRLPFGVRTGDKDVDSVVITAHDKFNEVIQEANDPNSILHAGGMIWADMEKQKQIAQSHANVQLQLIPTEGEHSSETQTLVGKVKSEMCVQENDDSFDNLYNMALDYINDTAAQKLESEKQENLTAENLKKDLSQRAVEPDLQKYIEAIFNCGGDELVDEIRKKVMYLPKLRTEEIGEEQYIIKDFDLDMTLMSYVPLTTDVVIKSLTDNSETVVEKANSALVLKSFDPKMELAKGLSEIPEVDYRKCSSIIKKIIMQFLTHYAEKGYDYDMQRNIVFANKNSIISQMKEQLISHIAVKYEGAIEAVVGVQTEIIRQQFDTAGGTKDIHEVPEENISSIVYTGAKKSLTDLFKFDSEPERIFAIVCEDSPEVINWLRPDSRQFNITYNHGHLYEPDFVVETNDCYYLVEVKARNKMSDPDVLSKKDRAEKYCKLASAYNVAQGHKPFRYVFIPHDEILSNSSFKALKDRFVTEEDKKDGV
jgi:type III restriction enzyme